MGAGSGRAQEVREGAQRSGGTQPPTPSPTPKPSLQVRREGGGGSGLTEDKQHPWDHSAQRDAGLTNSAPLGGPPDRSLSFFI